MKEISLQLLSQTLQSKRKAKNLTQADVAKATGLHRSIISKIESMEHVPSVNQLQALSEVLDFDTRELFVEPGKEEAINKEYKIAVAGTGYVGLSLAVLLSQHNQVTAVDIIPEKVEKLNNYISPIQDEYIEKYLAEAKAGTRSLILQLQQTALLHIKMQTTSSSQLQPITIRRRTSSTALPLSQLSSLYLILQRKMKLNQPSLSSQQFQLVTQSQFVRNIMQTTSFSALSS